MDFDTIDINQFFSDKTLKQAGAGLRSNQDWASLQSEFFSFK